MSCIPQGVILCHIPSLTSLPFLFEMFVRTPNIHPHRTTAVEMPHDKSSSYRLTPVQCDFHAPLARTVQQQYLLLADGVHSLIDAVADIRSCLSVPEFGLEEIEIQSFALRVWVLGHGPTQVYIRRRVAFTYVLALAGATRWSCSLPGNWLYAPRGYC